MKTATIIMLLASVGVGKQTEPEYLEKSDIVFDLQKWEDGFIYYGAWREAIGKVHDVQVDGKWVKCLLLEIRREYNQVRYESFNQTVEYYLIIYEYKVIGRIR